MLHSIRFDQLNSVLRGKQEFGSTEVGIPGHLYMILPGQTQKAQFERMLNEYKNVIKEVYRSPLFKNSTHPERPEPYLFISIVERL
jgi:hypothetical protein